MTWLTVDRDEDSSDLEAVLALQPEAAHALRGLLAASVASVEAELLEPASVRLAQVLDVPDSLLVELVGLAPAAVVARRQELASWPSAPGLTDRQRLVVAHAEQFAIDVDGIGAGDVDALLEVLPPDELFRLQVALGVVERALRFCRVFEIVPANAPTVEVAR